MHASKKFLVTTSLTSALYLCAMRFLCGNYAACFDLADSIASTDKFTPEEAQIFELFGSERKEAHLDAHHAAACLCKIALAVESSTTELPFDLSNQLGLYAERVGHMAVECRLTEPQELALISIVLGDRKEARSLPATTAVLLRNRRRYLNRSSLPQLAAAIAAGLPLDGKPKPAARATSRLRRRPVADPRLQVRLDGQRVEHVTSTFSVGREDDMRPLLRNGTEMYLEGSSLVHAPSRRSIGRSDGLCRNGDAVRIRGASSAAEPGPSSAAEGAEGDAAGPVVFTATHVATGTDLGTCEVVSGFAEDGHAHLERGPGGSTSAAGAPPLAAGRRREIGARLAELDECIRSTSSLRCGATCRRRSATTCARSSSRG